MDFNKALTTITGAAIIGAILLNAKGANELVQSVFSGTGNYITAIQARPGPLG